MYAIVEDNNITQYINNPKSVVIGDVRYPAKIFKLWSQSELNAIGIYEVITDTNNYKDEAYYINTNEQYNFADNQVTKSWGTATPKRLEDENAVDEDGNNLLDDDGNQVINYGLKTEKKRIVKQQASGLLAPTDWYVVKSTEVADYDVPANVLSFRADVRTKSNEMETQIDACTTVDELKALYEYTNTGTEANPVITRPLAEFPEEI
nr:N-acetylmuramidase/lysin [uncultured Mediterranean phage uvMED]BAR37688.1 N-acetylmuramidase/lysin [uncultured Mediterranean phage uvMED]